VPNAGAEQQVYSLPDIIPKGCVVKDKHRGMTIIGAKAEFNFPSARLRFPSL